MRNLASIVTITNAYKHPNADSLDICEIGGWKCVTKLNQFKTNDKAIYIEIDSILPINEHFSFLTQGKEPKIYDGIPGIRLTTKKLRGEISQGLLMPLSILGNDTEDDITSILGIRKYEPPLPACLFGLAKGNFPSFIPKTDLTRVQSLVEDFEEWKVKYTWTIEEKIDGSSTTVFFKDELNVCSRNLNLKETEGNSYWNMANKYLKSHVENNELAFQFETYGHGINGNLYKKSVIDACFFDIFDIKDQKYLLPENRNLIFEQLELPYAPLIAKNVDLSQKTIQDVLDMADGKSMIANVPREGLVFRSEQDSSVRFKVISNSYLLKYESN